MPKLSEIKNYCQQNNIKLTSLRQSVLEILIKHSQPISAYDLLDILKETNPQAKIMSVYRVLDFLRDHYIVHKINTTHTYSLCCHPSTQLCQLFICSQCGKKLETHLQDINQALTEIAHKKNFVLQQNKIELLGLCQRCSMEYS